MAMQPKDLSTVTRLLEKAHVGVGGHLNGEWAMACRRKVKVITRVILIDRAVS